MQDSAWNFRSTGEGTGEFNMWYDEMLAQRLVEGIGVPTVRLYQWKPWAISIGHHQDISGIDLSRCKADGIDVVRRPTGGRAILHAEELTYSVLMYANSKSIPQVYNEISLALVEGLREFGVEAALMRSQPNFAQLYKSPRSVPCFSSSARYEIEWNGRKFVGSAQRRYSSNSGDVVLQHGSILCGGAHRRLAEYLVLPDQVVRDSVQQDLHERTTDLHRIYGQPVDLEKLSACIKGGFERSWHIAFTDIDPLEGSRKVAYA